MSDILGEGTNKNREGATGIGLAHCIYSVVVVMRYS